MMYILLVLLSYMLRLICRQPGDPDNKDVEERMKENKDQEFFPLRGLLSRGPVPNDAFLCHVSGIPVPTGDSIFTGE